MLEQANEKIKKNSSILMDREKAGLFIAFLSTVSFSFIYLNLYIENFEKNAGDYWNKFYSIHENKFFKDRNWLFTEFPELILNEETSGDLSILEVGCGVGNTIFPILRANK